MFEIEKVRENIRLLDCSEAKSLLLFMYIRLNTEIKGMGEDESKQTIKELMDIYAALPDSRN